MLRCQFWQEMNTKHLELIIARKAAEVTFDALFDSQANVIGNDLWSS